MATKSKTEGPLSPHQSRVLAALLALSEAHKWNWWNRHSIGYVVGAGGFHGTIQISTIAILKSRGLVQTQRSSWSQQVRELVSCNCACCRWGLTTAGRLAADKIAMRWPEEALERMRKAPPDCGRGFDDEDEWRSGFGADDDDDDGDGPRSPVPSSPELITA